ncbi:MAG: hypothetical protein Q7R95_11015 [bacterium]|nr:hypothetical protein [bacterium]
MTEPRMKDFSRMPTSDITQEITTHVLNISSRGWLPNGLQQLVVGSVQYRPFALFMSTGANKGKSKGDQGFDELWEEWIKRYDPYSGENLAGTATYQHERYSPQDEKFPKVDTPEYEELTRKMGNLGSIIMIIEEKEGWRKMNDILSKIDSVRRSKK